MLPIQVSDLRAFVEVLTVMCGDVREAHEVRISEAAAKDKAARLEKALQVS